MANLAYLQVTRFCNQKCRFCSNPPSGWKDLTLAGAKKVIDKYIKEGYGGVILTGGEPTIYPFLPDLISYCRKKKLPSRLITNAQKTADKKYLDGLIKAGLEHIHVSIYSHHPEIQGYLTQNEESFWNIKKTLENLSNNVKKITVNVNITLNKQNSDHLSNLISFIVKNYPFVQHFVFNNLDPISDRVKKNKDTIPKLVDFELELVKALNFLEKNKKTFRIERTPLCYMPGFEHCSTETRKIVKDESRPLFFLDKRGFRVQKKFYRDKAKCCLSCSLNDICAGLYEMDKCFDSKELYPVFVSQEAVINRVLYE
jgi:MoaA/NifB/PqqE/SkfB family radical SAM enzyme